jgi:hypothetical protein
MRQQSRLVNTAFDDLPVGLLQTALDGAWNEVHRRHTGDAADVRRHLASRIVSQALAGERDVIRLREYALLPYLQPVS